MSRQLITMFLSFFKLGSFTFGGGYAMIPLIEREMVQKHGWIEKEEFVNLLALAQSAPGPMVVNVSIMVGYKILRTRGAVAAILGTVLPSFVIMLLIALFFSDHYNNPTINSIFQGMRPAVVALILHPVYTFAKGLKYWEYGVFIAIGVAIWQGLSPILFISGAICASVIYTLYKSKQLNK